MKAPDLSLPDEPAELRRRTRALVEQDPEGGTAVVDAGAFLADPLWERWGAALESAGMDRDRFAAIVTGYRRELWLWVMGERTWAQSGGGLLGRVQRRLPAGRRLEGTVETGRTTPTPSG
jgi:hypothetical protein